MDYGKSTNNGFNWVYMYGQNPSYKNLIEHGNTIFCCNSGVAYTTNSGVNWITWNEGLPQFNVQTALHIMEPYIFTAVGINLSSIYRRTLQDILGVQRIENIIPTKYSLLQNYPNPFNPTTKIKFQIPSDVKSHTPDVKLIIYDITGREIQTLINEKLNPGTYEVTFDGSNLPSGVYFYQLRAGDFVNTKKLILLK